MLESFMLCERSKQYVNSLKILVRCGIVMMATSLDDEPSMADRAGKSAVWGKLGIERRPVGPG